MKMKPEKRREFILSLIKSNPISFVGIHIALKKQGNEIKDRQLFQDISLLRKFGINGKGIPISLNEKKKYFIDTSVATWELDNLDDQIKNSLPFVLSLLKPYSYIPAVQYLIDDLDKHHSVKAKNLDQMLVAHNKVLSDGQRLVQSNILNAVKAIIEHMQNGKAILFNYLHVNDKKDDRYHDSDPVKIYPVQIRVYESRYYLLGIPVDKEIEPINLKTYRIDEIHKFMIESAWDDAEENEYTFNWKVTFKKLDIEGLYKYCIGILRPPDPDTKPVEIKRWFKDWAASLVEASPVHHTQKIEVVKGNEILVSLKVYDTIELDYFFDRFREFSWPHTIKNLYY